MTILLKKNSPIQAKVPASWHFFGEILVNVGFGSTPANHPLENRLKMSRFWVGSPHPWVAVVLERKQRVFGAEARSTSDQGRPSQSFAKEKCRKLEDCAQFLAVSIPKSL